MRIKPGGRAFIKPKRTSEILLVDGSKPAAQKSSRRTAERRAEEQEYVPVLVKRIDEVRRHPDDILESAINEGCQQHSRTTFSLFLSSIAAGLILGFTAMAVAVATVALSEVEVPLLRRLGTAVVYPLGFVVCIMSGSQLFTEHTATALYPVLDGRSPLRSLLRVWSIVIIGNLLGALISAYLLVQADPVIGAEQGYVEIGRHLVSQSFVPLFVSSLLAGWLMAQGGWLVFSTPPGLSQPFSIYVVTFLIGIGGLHHSIAGAVEMAAAFLSASEFTLNQSLSFVSIALFGNCVGGSCFVALLNYAHIRQTQMETSEESRQEGDLLNQLEDKPC